MSHHLHGVHRPSFLVAGVIKNGRNEDIRDGPATLKHGNPLGVGWIASFLLCSSRLQQNKMTLVGQRQPMLGQPGKLR